MATQQQQHKPPFYERIGIFFGEVRTELSKVSWPTQEQVKQYTIVVLIGTAIMSTLISIWDAGLGWVLDKLLGL